jgi:hypothetical protein
MHRHNIKRKRRGEKEKVHLTANLAGSRQKKIAFLAKANRVNMLQPPTPSLKGPDIKLDC